MKKSLLLIALCTSSYHCVAQSSHSSSDKSHHYFGTEEFSRVSKETLEIDAVADFIIPYNITVLGKEIKPFVFVQVPFEFPIQEKEWWRLHIPWTAIVGGGEHEFPLLDGRVSISVGVGVESYFHSTEIDYSLRLQAAGLVAKGPFTLTVMGGVGEQPLVSAMASYQLKKLHVPQFVKHLTIGIRHSNLYGSGFMAGYTLKRFTLFAGILNSFDRKDSPWTPALMFRTNLN